MKTFLGYFLGIPATLLLGPPFLVFLGIRGAFRFLKEVTTGLVLQPSNAKHG